MHRTNVHSVLLIVSMEKQESVHISRAIQKYCKEKDMFCDVLWLNNLKGKTPSRSYDLAISIGGDGTVLFASRILSPHSTPILPVNVGNFGFITEIGSDEWEEALDLYLVGKIAAGERLLLTTEVQRKNKKVYSYVGLNDSVISGSGVSKLISSAVYVGDQFLGDFRSDGMIAATPTGSTAYSISAGGPVLHPEMKALILNPICPFTLSIRPMVLPHTEKVRICLNEDQRTSILLTIDGQQPTKLLPGDTIVIQTCPEMARIVRPYRRTFYEVLRTKLGWSGDASA